MPKKLLSVCLWAMVNAALLFGSLNDIPALLHLADGVIWIMLVLCWGIIAIIAMLIGCVSGGMDDQSIKAYDSQSKMVEDDRKKGKLRKIVGTIQLIISVCSIALAGWVVTAVLYFMTSVLLRLVYNVAVSKLDDIDKVKAG
jgi:hypothetical protein